MFKPIRPKEQNLQDETSPPKSKSLRVKEVHGVPLTKSKRARPGEMPRTGRATPKIGPRGVKVITLQEIKQQASVMINKLYNEIAGDETKMSKNVTAAWANVVDKWAMLSGRPTEIIGHVEVEKQRPGLVKLASRIASSRDKESA